MKSSRARRSGIGRRSRSIVANKKCFRYPVIGDFHQLENFGVSMQDQKAPTISRARARGKGFFVIDENLQKHRLTVTDIANLQGWPTELQHSWLGIQDNVLPETKLIEALGNGFSCHVFEAIFRQLLYARVH